SAYEATRWRLHHQHLITRGRESTCRNGRLQRLEVWLERFQRSPHAGSQARPHQSQLHHARFSKHCLRRRRTRRHEELATPARRHRTSSNGFTLLSGSRTPKPHRNQTQSSTKKMKRFLVLVLTSLLASSTIISQSAQEPPELAQATELTNSVAKLFKEDKFDEALPLARRALEIRERLLPRTDPRITMSLGYVGDLYVAKRDYDNAKKTFERLLQLQEEQGGPNDVKLASTLDRL